MSKAAMTLTVYELVSSPLLKVLPKLLEKVIEQQQRCVIHLQDEKTVEELDQSLWTYNPSAFLPHGSHRDGYAGRQPIWLTMNIENPNQASLFMSVCAPLLHPPAPAQKSIFLFEHTNLQAKEQARTVALQAAQETIPTTWWVQNDQGGWSQTPSIP